MTETITQIPQLPPRPVDGHKGLFGKVLLIAGSRGMIGAPSLAANAALRCGAGLVRLALPRSIQLTVAAITPCATTLALPDNNHGIISRTAISDIFSAIDDNDAVALGPGLSQDIDLQYIVKQIIKHCKKPLVIDADGLNNLAGTFDRTITFFDNTVLTPHPGEFARLWEEFMDQEMPSERHQQAEMLAQRTGTVVVLKGADTVVTDGKSTYINKTGNPGMAAGGTGDVLTGCIAALLANQVSGLTALESTILAVHVHGLAGDLAAQELTHTSLIATDLIDYLGRAWSVVCPKI